MKAAVLDGPGMIRICELEKPKPKAGEVLVKVGSVGVCGSDVHYYTHGRIGRYVVKKPIVLGHECAGEVVELGEGVRELRIGDRVSIEPGVPCRKCSYCKTGRYNLCPDVAFMATPPINGAFMEYVVHPEDFTFKLPNNITIEEGALIEPLAVGVYSCEQARIGPGSSVVILGSGVIGLMVLQAAKAYGANKVTVVDVIASRLEHAKRLGADFVFDVSGCCSSELLQEQADVVVEAAGAIASVQLTTTITKRGGRVILIGLPGKDLVECNINDIISKEINVIGIFRYANCYEKAIKLVQMRKIELSSMITNRFSLDETKKALDASRDKKIEVLKAVINIS